MIKLIVVSSSVVVGLAAVAWRLGFVHRPEGVGGVLLFCAAINLIACWLSCVPLAVVRYRRPEYIPQAALGAMVIRLLIVVSATVAAMTFGPWQSRVLSVWMILFYLALLAVKTTFAVRVVSSIYGSHGRESA